jgi:hypothetical protein
MGTLSRDTSPEAEQVMIGILREMPPWRRLELLEDACLATLELARAGLRNRHPEADSEAIHRLLLDLTLGSELAEEAFGPLDP